MDTGKATPAAKVRESGAGVPSRPRAHDLVVRLTHWAGAVAMLCMILSGWQIYNASPILPFVFPAWMTLGGWLGAGIAWHIASMWLLMAAGIIYLAWGTATGHFRRDLLPISAHGVARDLGAALRLRLVHRMGEYNAVQRLLYAAVLVLGLLAVLTGLSIWKPVQLGALAWVFGGYDLARKLHFAAMTGITGFLVIHVALVILVPSTLVSMITGGRRARAEAAEAAREAGS